MFDGCCSFFEQRVRSDLLAVQGPFNPIADAWRECSQVSRRVTQHKPRPSSGERAMTLAGETHSIMGASEGESHGDLADLSSRVGIGELSV